MKRDVFDNKGRYERWKEDPTNDEITKKNSDIIFDYITDMEQGKNIAKGTKKGGRSYKRLNTLRIRIGFIARKLEERGVRDITKTTESKIFDLFNDMRKGKIRTQRGEIYRSVGDYVKDFKAFWHWLQKVNKKQGKIINDITTDLDNSSEDSKFVLVTKEDMERMLPHLNPDQQIIVRFAFDSLIRSPTEILSLQVKHIERRGETIWVHIPDDISKVMGRSLNLLYCGDDLMKYIQQRNLKDNDYLFNFSSVMLNKKLQKVAEKLWGSKLSHPKAGGLYKEMTLYDFRHSGAVHFRRLAQKTGKISLDSIRERGGWKDLKMLNYYTKFIFLEGNINKEDLLISEDKTKIEKDIEALKETLKKQEKFSDMYLKVIELYEKEMGKKIVSFPTLPENK